MPSYTPVPAFYAGEIIDEVFLNTYWRDNMAAGIPDLFSAKGQMAIALGVDSMGVLNVGADGNVLTADSTETLGVKWSAANKMTRLRKSANQSLPGSSATTTITWDTEDQDDEVMHDNVTNNSRITFPRAGVYRIEAQLLTGVNVSFCDIRLNGSQIVTYRPNFSGGNYDMPVSIVTSVVLNDYAECTVTTTASADTLFSTRSKFIATRLA
jgi:hypothetical protein